TARALNEAPDPRPNIPAESLYTAAGWVQKGVLNQIQTDMLRKFPGKEAPRFPGITPDSLLAYAYLEPSVRFSLPYRENTKPLFFKESTGQTVDVTSFGLSRDDADAYERIRHQAVVLFWRGEGRDDTLEFAVDLCSN